MQKDADSVNMAPPQYPLVDSIALEIRTHLEDAKDEMTVLQRQYEQQLIKRSVKLGLSNNKNSSVFVSGKSMGAMNTQQDIADADLVRQL